MSKIISYVIIGLLFVSCAGTRGTDNSDQIRRFGNYRFHSDSYFGEGTILYQKDSQEEQCTIYSPFGKKIFELSRFGETIIVKDPEGFESIERISNPAYIPTLLENGSVTYGELFTLLSGHLPEFLKSPVEECLNDQMITIDRGDVSVNKRRGELRKVEFHSEQLVLLLEGRGDEAFRSINLKTGDRNYFQVNYE